MDPLTLGALAATAGLKAFNAYSSSVSQGQITQAQGRSDQVRAESVLTDLPFARGQIAMAQSQVEMASRAASGEVAMSEAQMARMDLELELTTLDAERQEQARMREAKLTDAAATTLAVSMGFDPSSSGSFTALMVENQRVVAGDVTAIQLTAAARKAGIQGEKARILGDRGAILMQEGANQGQGAQLVRGLMQASNSEREATYAKQVGRFTEDAGRRRVQTAWLAAAGSLFGDVMSAQRAGAFK
jgi:hypothetical protein